MPSNVAEFVDIWEQGNGIGLSERAQLLLSREHPAMTGEELDKLTIGARDAMLLALRERIFGPWLESVIRCPQCSETLEIRRDLRELLDDRTCEDPETEWKSGNVHVRFRVPNSGDLRDLEKCRNREEARALLIERCTMEAHRGERRILPSQLTSEEETALADRVAEADPYGELVLINKCPNCAHRWPTVLDIASFLWQELALAVKRLLGEVHALAWAYSWSERDILAMSAHRRRLYLELLAG